MSRNKRPSKRSSHPLALWGLCLLLPFLMGGCPEFRNEVVNAVDTAVQGVVLGDVETDEAFDSASQAALGAAFDLLFDQFRTDQRTF